MLKNQANEIVTDSTEKVEILNKQFKSVCTVTTVEDTSTIPDEIGVPPLTLRSQILLLHSMV